MSKKVMGRQKESVRIFAPNTAREVSPDLTRPCVTVTESNDFGRPFLHSNNTTSKSNPGILPIDKPHNVRFCRSIVYFFTIKGRCDNFLENGGKYGEGKKSISSIMFPPGKGFYSSPGGNALLRNSYATQL
jgi:hypothetical protein